MTKLMICPKIGKPKNEHSSCSACLHNKPQERHDSCIHADKICHYCIPYKRELKVGDRVRVLGKTKGSSPGGMQGAPHMVGDIGVVTKICLDYVVADYKMTTSGNHFASEDLELITEGDMKTEAKYKTTKAINAIYLYEHHKHECLEFFSHFATLLHDLKPSHIGGWFKQDSFIAWAEQDPARIKWLLEKGYIEEVELEVFYKRGDRFKSPGGDTAKICIHWFGGSGQEHLHASLVYESGVNKNQSFSQAVKVKDQYKIFKDEFAKICGSGKWEKI